MPSAFRVRQASPAAPLCAATALLTTLAACGGGSMGTAPMSMATDVGSTSASTSCTGAYTTMDSNMNMNMNMNMGMGSNMSMGGNAMPCAAPSIVLTTPAASVTRTMTLHAQVKVPTGDAVMRVDFMVDSAPVGTTSDSGFSVSWDSTTVSDGRHTLTATVTDSLGQTASATPVTLQVDNHPAFTVALSPAQIVPAPAGASSGTAHLSADLGSGALSGSVVLSGVTATAVTLNEAFAGDQGAVLLSLSPGTNSGEWQVPGGALLSAEQITALLQGGLYVTASSAANPGGELRGQITPTSVLVIFSAMSGAQEVPAVAINATGVAATTVDTVANTLTVHVHAIGVADAIAAEVDDGAAGATGSRIAALTRDDSDPSHWSTQLTGVNTADVSAFKAGDWYVNVMTPADPQGAIRGQIQPTGH
jgi:CHRD domain/Bacterial Ig domain